VLAGLSKPDGPDQHEPRHERNRERASDEEDERGQRSRAIADEVPRLIRTAAPAAGSTAGGTPFR
jgi:hypothetical protein